MASVANEVRAIGEYFVAIGCAGFGPNGVFAIERKFRNRFSPGDVAVASVVEDDAFAVGTYPQNFDGLCFIRSRKVFRRSRYQNNAADQIEKGGN